MKNDNSSGNAASLVRDENGVSLVGDGLVLRGDFTRLLPRIRRENLSGELVVRAARIKGKCEGLTVADATAGLGEDSFLLAAAGFYVTLIEHNPVIAELLRDALERAKKIPELSDIVGRLTLIEQDSVEVLPKLTFAPDVVMLDPMFPERHKSSLVKKKLQLLQQLESPCDNGEALFSAALRASPRRIIVKRPSKGAYLTDRKPDYSIENGTIRFDCFTINGKDTAHCDK